MLKKKFFEKVNKFGFVYTFELIAIKIFKFIFYPLSRFMKYLKLLEKGRNTVYKYEDNIKILLPSFSFLTLFFDRDKTIDNNLILLNSPEDEILYRKLINYLFKIEYISKYKSIIDIGSYVGDNSFVWSKYIEYPNKVFSIDPSEKNLNYIKKVCLLNDIRNITTISSVCSYKVGLKLEYTGSINHTSFYEKEKSNSYLRSNTIDNILVNYNNVNIGFFHIDVEGSEFNVIKGGLEMIKSNRPFIAFEQHLYKDNLYPLVFFLKDLNYEVYMVNEIHPGSLPDCRNFVAFQNNSSELIIRNFNDQLGSNKDYIPATIGPSLIKL